MNWREVEATKMDIEEIPRMFETGNQKKAIYRLCWRMESLLKEITELEKRIESLEK